MNRSEPIARRPRTKAEESLEQVAGDEPLSPADDEAAENLSARVVAIVGRIMRGEPVDSSAMAADEIFTAYVVGRHFLEKYDKDLATGAETRSRDVIERLDAKATAAVTIAMTQERERLVGFLQAVYPQVRGRLETEMPAIAAPITATRENAQLPQTLPQSTFQEAKRVARGLALGPSGVGWQELLGEFALIHNDDESGAEHYLRLEGALIPEWWGRPNDNASLRRELAETGHDGIALFYNAIGLVLYSEKGFVDVEIDELITRIGMDPRSKAERTEARLKVWRILTILGAMEVFGERRSVIRDRLTGKKVHVESSDALLAVKAWRTVGSQVPFDAGVAPVKVTINSSPWLARWRGNRAALQDFGNLLAISEIPIGQPSGAWARAIGWALQQFWREEATRATYGRAGEGNRPTARFRDVTRRELLSMFPPNPSAQDVLGGPHPSRAIDYCEAAIATLKVSGEAGLDPPRSPVIGFYAAARDWKHDRPRKGWADAWLDEPLDIRPASEATQVLSSVARAAKTKRRRDSKLAQSDP